MGDIEIAVGSGALTLLQVFQKLAFSLQLRFRAMLKELLGEFLYHFGLQAFVYHFYFSLKKPRNRFVVRKVIINLPIVNVHNRILLGLIMHTLKNYPVAIRWGAVPIELVSFYNVLVCWAKSDDPFFVVTQQPFLVLGQPGESYELVIILQRLYVILLYQLSRLLVL